MSNGSCMVLSIARTVATLLPRFLLVDGMTYPIGRRRHPSGVSSAGRWRARDGRGVRGGLQMAIGIFALIGAFRPKHRDSVLLFFVLALSGLAMCRLGGLIAEHSSSYLTYSLGKIPAGKYNQEGLAMYELPNMIFAWVLCLLRPRRRDAETPEVETLRTENELLRSQLVVRTIEAQ